MVMGQLRLTLALLFITSVSIGQQLDFDLKNITFRGLEFSTTKQEIINNFGETQKIETKYECGFFSNDQEGGPYYQLSYGHFNYIGSDKERFYLEHVKFDAKGETKVLYLNNELTGQTTQEEFIRIFGDKARDHFEKHPKENSVLLFSKGSDDGAIFTFKNGRLEKFEYWTPC